MIPINRGGSDYYTQDYYVVKDYKNKEIERICKAPLPIIYEALSKARGNGFDNLWNLGIEDVFEIIIEAGRIFKSDIRYGKDSIDYETHLEWITRCTGLPYKYVVSLFDDLTFALRNIDRIIKKFIPFNITIFDDLVSENVAFTPKGKVLTTILPSNLPTPNFFWVLAQSVKYPVILRPSTSEPFTAYRLSKSLYDAGLPEKSNYYLPCDRDKVSEILLSSDLGMIFGSREIVERYGVYKNIKVFGPGNSKILIDADYYGVDDVIEDVKKSMMDKGGRSCLNASQLFVTGDSANRILKDIFDALNEELPTEFEDPLDEDAEIPAFPDKMIAKNIAQFLRLNGVGDVLVEVEGVVFLKPTLVLCEYKESLFTELPFQYLAMTAISKNDVENFLRDSLVVSVYTEEPTIIKRLILNTTIKNVFIKKATIDSTLEEPHEGNLINFLYDFKTVKGFEFID